MPPDELTCSSSTCNYSCKNVKSASPGPHHDLISVNMCVQYYYSIPYLGAYNTFLSYGRISTLLQIETPRRVFVYITY